MTAGASAKPPNLEGIEKWVVRTNVLLASVIGTIVCNLGGLFLLRGMAVMGTSELGLTIFLIIFAAFLAYYARAMGKTGVLS